MNLAGVRYYEDSFSQMNGFTSTLNKPNMLPGCFISCCKNIFPAYHHRLPWCSLCLHIQMFPCCPQMLSRKAALLILGRSLVRLRKPFLNEEFLLFLVFSISAHSGSLQLRFPACSMVSMETSPKLWALICLFTMFSFPRHLCYCMSFLRKQFWRAGRVFIACRVFHFLLFGLWLQLAISQKIAIVAGCNCDLGFGEFSSGCAGVWGLAWGGDASEGLNVMALYLIMGTNWR